MVSVVRWLLKDAQSHPLKHYDSFLAALVSSNPSLVIPPSLLSRIQDSASAASPLLAGSAAAEATFGEDVIGDEAAWQEVKRARSRSRRRQASEEAGVASKAGAKPVPSTEYG